MDFKVIGYYITKNIRSCTRRIKKVLAVILRLLYGFICCGFVSRPETNDSFLRFVCKGVRMRTGR